MKHSESLLLGWQHDRPKEDMTGVASYSSQSSDIVLVSSDLQMGAKAHDTRGKLWYMKGNELCILRVTLLKPFL